jgi:hypothetical protein
MTERRICPAASFEPTVLTNERMHSDALDRAVIGIGRYNLLHLQNKYFDELSLIIPASKCATNKSCGPEPGTDSALVCGFKYHSLRLPS